ncbi:hypothetical protein [Macrococcus equipercicus]|uniref:Uncharacterized protein n=1 Tax=Macrococcus equipercicus TaxID=69967 RepID=A0A9Q9F2H1_9STAP|nr:hypothetical protein [Macrococcus equipercicus]UTH12824.1 hypothetical protein KFV11_05925 [Macrococcus equipercicus]
MAEILVHTYTRQLTEKQMETQVSSAFLIGIWQRFISETADSHVENFRFVRYIDKMTYK